MGGRPRLAAFVAASFLILVGTPIGADDEWGTAIRVPVVIMVVMATWIALALGRPPRHVVSPA